MYRPNLIKQAFHDSRRFLAKNWLSVLPVIQIAITGSQGKTNTTQIVYRLLSKIRPTISTDIDLDTIYNVPITALKIMPWTKYAVFELGIDRKEEMDLHLQIVKPRVAIVTGISPVHTDQEHLGSLANLIREKRKLVESIPGNGVTILNGDDRIVREMASASKAPIVYYGLGKNNHIRAEDIKNDLKGVEFSIKIAGENSFTIKTRLIGSQHTFNIMAAYAVYRYLGYTDLQYFKEAVEAIKPLTGRMSLEKGPDQTNILDDSLRANPASTAFGLKTLSEIKYPDGRKIAVLCEMGELEKPVDEHKKIGRLIAGLNIDYLISVGSLQRFTADQAIRSGMDKNRVYAAANVIECAKILKKIIKKNDLLYFKGSRLKHIERVLMILRGDEVRCPLTSCPAYIHCSKCPRLRIDN
jgi:UDP-N-acetylmuramoyl-tripeptide--D-alanyl-D-alanine ligase